MNCIVSVYLLMGSASSSMRGVAFAFLAASLTVKTPGLNCTLSIVSLTMGFESSPILRGEKKDREARGIGWREGEGAG